MGYRALLSRPHVRRLYLGWVLARLPAGMNATAILLVATQVSGLALGGLAAAVYSLGAAAGTFAMPRLIGRLGPSRALSRYGVVHAVAQLALAVSAVLSVGFAGRVSVVLLAAAAVGLTVPPSSQCLRALWSRVLPEQAALTTGSLEGATTNVVFILGPAIAGVAAVVGQIALAPLFAAACSLVGCVVLASAGPMRRWSAEPDDDLPVTAHWRALQVPGAARRLESLTLVMAAAAGADISLFNIGAANDWYGGGAGLLTAAGVMSILASVWHGTSRIVRSRRWWLTFMTTTIALAGFAVVVLAAQQRPTAASVVAIALLLTMQLPISVLFIDLVLVLTSGTAPADRVGVLAWRTAANLSGNGLGELTVAVVIAGAGALRSGTVTGALLGIGAGLIASAVLGVLAEVLAPPEQARVVEPCPTVTA